jgi:arsenite methyltransferase
MNRHNAKVNTFTRSQLQLMPTDRVLEIGFGGGPNLQFLIANAAHVAGVDRSKDVVTWANKKYAAAVNAGRAEFREGTVAALPFQDASFDKVFTVHTIYFWTSLEGGCREIYRVLATG